MIRAVESRRALLAALELIDIRHHAVAIYLGDCRREPSAHNYSALAYHASALRRRSVDALEDARARRAEHNVNPRGGTE